MESQEIQIKIKDTCVYKTTQEEDQLIYITEEGQKICSLCYSVCFNKKHDMNDIKIEYASYNVCKCLQCHLSYMDCKKQFENLFNNMNNSRDLLALNDFLSQSVDNQKTIIFKLWQADAVNIINDLELIESNQKNIKFEWDVYNIDAIESRINFIKFFNKDIRPEYLIGIDTRNLFEIFPLEYIIKIFYYPENSFGQPIYNTTLTYHTYLMNFFLQYHIRKDFFRLNQVDAVSLKNLRIEDRYKLSIINRAQITKKYFSNQFNLVDFVFTLLENFIPTIHWRWIGGNHKMHIYSIQLTKLIFSYFLVNEEESDEIMNLLSNKINNLIVLEQSIDRDSHNINQNWIKIWREGMSCIRQYLVEIILYMSYLKLDCLILSKKSNQFNTYGKNIFESDFFMKAQDIILNYVLSDKQICGISLINREIEQLSIEFFNFLYDYYDGYSLNLTTYHKPQILPDLLSHINSSLNKLDQIINDYCIQKTMAFNEVQVQKEFKQLLEGMMLVNPDVFQFLILPKLILVAKLFKGFFFKDEELGQQMRIVLENIFQNSSYCFILQYNQCQQIQDLLEIWPNQIIQWLNFIFDVNPRIFMNKYLYLLLLRHYSIKIQNNIKKMEHDSERLDHDAIKLLHSETLLLQKYLQNKNNQEDFDLIGQQELMQYFDQIMKGESIAVLLERFKQDQSDSRDLYIYFIFEYLNLINMISTKRYFNDTLTQVKSLSWQNVIELSQICENHLQFHNYISKLVYIFFIDPKENLINQRTIYFVQKPVDPIYSEDIFSEDQFSYIFQYFSRSYQNKLINHDEEKLFNFVNQNYLYSGILKFCNLLLRSQTKDIHKYISQLHLFEDFAHLIAGMEEYNNQELEARITSFENNPRKIILIIEFIKEIVQGKIIKDIITETQQISLLGFQKNRPYLYNSQYHENINVRLDYFQKNPILVQNPSNLSDGISVLKKSYLENKQQINLYSPFSLDSQIRNSQIVKQSFEYSNKITNLCNFFNELLSRDDNNFYYQHNAIHIFCNISFRDTGTFSEIFGKYLRNQKKNKLLDNVWHDFRRNFSIIRYKGIEDELYCDAFEKTNILLIFHRFLLKNSPTFRDIFGVDFIEHDKLTRADRFQTLMEKLFDENILNDKNPKNMNPDFLYLQKDIFHTQFMVIQESSRNKILIYNYLADRYRNTLEKFDIRFNPIQINLLKFLNELMQDKIPEINQFLSDNIEYSIVQNLLYKRINDFFYQNFEKKNQMLTFKNYQELIMKYKQTQNNHTHSEYLDCAIECFKYIKFINSYNLELQIQRQNVYYYFLNEIVFELEFLNSQGDLMKILIKNDLKCQYLTNRTKTLIFELIDKSSFYSQLKSITNMLPYIDFETQYLYNRSFGMTLNNYYPLFQVICIYMGLVINILIWEDYKQLRDIGPQFQYSGKYKQIVQILSYIIIAISGLMIILYMKYTFSLEYKKKIFFREYKKQKNVNLFEKIWILLLECFIFNAISGQFVWYLAACLSAMHASQQNYFILVIFSMNLFKGFRETMFDIFRRIVQLILIYIFVLLIIYGFAYSAWAQYQEDIFKLYLNSRNELVNPCSKSLLECFFHFANKGFREGMGQLTNYESFNGDDHFFYIKNILDIIFYLLVQVGFIAIVVALIIDGINEGNRMRRQIKLMLEKCLVCNTPRNQFDKIGVDYEIHYKGHHSIWKYACLMINFMKEKSKSFDNFEFELLRNKMEQKNLSWYPNHYLEGLVQRKKKKKSKIQLSEVKTKFN